MNDAIIDTIISSKVVASWNATWISINLLELSTKINAFTGINTR